MRDVFRRGGHGLCLEGGSWVVSRMGVVTGCV